MPERTAAIYLAIGPAMFQGARTASRSGNLTAA
ncbi:hypothetical protein SAMN05421819_2001 [Bryocella elongata]|uniref:Uncharacterized protein n=1 Tax=Bryocella elongata TaxID=863522 RepID=A0A1H5XW96_9BACT|nr:hypothetical protein SAMN05421819_2001 [Bryocella elongata]